MTSIDRFLADPAFARTGPANDLPRLARARVVVAGTGGVAGAIANLERSGVGEFVLIDPDRVEAPNLGTQDYERADIGRFKVEALGRRLLRINPRVAVLALAQPLESCTGNRMRELLRAPMSCLLRNPEARPRAPSAMLLLGMTDHFPAQAMVNRVAVRESVPSLCVQIYREGRAFELTFTHPGVTEACHRCILRRRYEAYEQGHRNEVGSAGSPLATTSAANALTELVAMTLLHGREGATRWSRLLTAMGRRNLVQMRLDPDVAETLGIGAFDRTFAGADHNRLLVSEPIWLPQARDPRCPVCSLQ
ncbi:MAG: ThiF family adenylyltransferase [Enhydrobacter sp.]|nr:MAG: ThiF family adenylyltransferase [Enhydrobacter sp.]